MRITILGFGLIGGSIARALHERGERGAWQVTAWSRTARPVEAAVADGVVAVAAPTIESAIRDAELIVLAGPPLICLEQIDLLAGPLRTLFSPDCSITDVASAKARIVDRANAAGLPFIGGHPMAGREVTGYAAALPDLFVDRPWVTVLGKHARLCDGERVGELVETCGAVQIPMAARTHDGAVAAISHMPLVISAALVEAVAGGKDQPERADWRAAESLAATGWAGMTRLAKGDPAMGAGIAATNARAIASRLHDVRDVIDEWLAELEREGGPDTARLAARFATARARLIPPEQ